jgi:hypothetical protein
MRRTAAEFELKIGLSDGQTKSPTPCGVGPSFSLRMLPCDPYYGMRVVATEFVIVVLL